MKVELVLNGRPEALQTRPGELLLHALRRHGCAGVKHGCETGDCGACAVIVDGRAVNSCVMLAAQAAGRQLVTIEGIAAAGAAPGGGGGGAAGRGGPPLHPLQRAFIETGAIQCGYCTPGFIVAARALLDRNPRPTEGDVRDALAGVLCRCTGYLKPVQAVLRAAAVMRGEEPPPLPVVEAEGGADVDWQAIIAGQTPVGPGHGGHGRDPDPPGGAPGNPFQRDGDEGPPGWGRDDYGDSPMAGSRSGASRGMDRPGPGAGASPGAPGAGGGVATVERPVDLAALLTSEGDLRVVGKPAQKVDAVKLALGRPAFVDDVNLPGMLYGKLLLSPHAHARIRRIDASRARALPGVHAVLTHHDVPRVTWTSAGQTWPEPSPHDMRSLDDKVRHVGDRVAAVAAETPEIAAQALKLIEVDYEVLPAILDPRDSMKPGAPVIHDEPDISFVYDARRNLAARLEAQTGDMEAGFAQADLVYEAEYEVPQVQQTSIEPHICITYWDEDDRLVVRSSTQVPYHARRMIAPLIGIPPKRIRVIKPRIGGGFGGKQEVLIEDICAHLTIATGRPVRLEYTRAEEFTSARSRHPQIIRMKTGVRRDGTIVANEMLVLANTGAYGSHGKTVQSNTGFKTLPLYKSENTRFVAEVVYTNLPPPGAFRGYGVPQGFFALESHMDEIAHRLGLDPIEFRRRNWVDKGDRNHFSKTLAEGKKGLDQIYQSCGLRECATAGAEAIGWAAKRGELSRPGASGPGSPPMYGPGGLPDPNRPWVRRGVGVASAMHGSGIAGIDMAAAAIKMNDDGSFNLQVGATDIGTGADTVLAQIAAEVLGCPVSDIVVYSSDTDFTPFDTGAYASSTTYVSGGAVKRAAEEVRWQICKVAGRLLDAEPEHVRLANRRAWAPDGRSVTLVDVALHSLHVSDQHQIQATASWMSNDSPPPFGVQFAEVEVDTETGQVTVLQMVSAIDCGRAVNPLMAEGQIEGAETQAAGYAICEEMVFDPSGRCLTTNLRDYKIYAADEMPELKTILVETHDPFGPFGVKAVGEIPIDAMAPAIANAVFHATGARLTRIPMLPERVARALREAGPFAAG